MVKVRQIYFQKAQYGMLQFEPYFNPKADKYLENSVILRLWEEKDHVNSGYYGVFSYLFRNKIRKTKQEVYSQIKDADVYSFFGRNNLKVNVWVQGQQWHPLFTEIAELLFKKLGIDNVLELNTPQVYSNHWIASEKVFDKYCTELLKPAMELMESDKELKELLNQDANYITEMRASPEKCKEIFGFPYYTYHPFICERFMSTFIALNNLNLVHI